MSFITVTGVLTNPSGAILPNYNILFEAIRTSDTVINNTDVLIVTNSSGGYSFELGYGTYTLKIKSGREARYSTVASNILIYSQVLDNNSIQQIILAQDDLEDINIELIDQLLQIRADVLLNAQNASTSETNAAASEANALASKNAAAASATSASSSAATATTKASEAASSATSALASKNAAATSETNAAASAAAALTSANNADISEANALASANAADVSEANALASANTAEAAKTAAEAARDVANSSAGIYHDTTSGLAGTSTGEYFSVPSPLDDEVLILYLNDTGIATEVKRYPNTAWVENTREAMTAMAASLVLTQSIIAAHHAFEESQHEAMIAMAASQVLTQSIIAAHHAFV